MQTPSSGNPRMKRVRLLTSTMTFLTAAFCLYWTNSTLGFIGPFIFGGGFEATTWVDEGATVSFGQKAAYFRLWLTVAVAAWFTFYAAIRMLLTLRIGAFFAVETCRRIQVFGAALVVTFILDTILTIVQFPIITWNNPADGAVGNMAATYYFNSASITIMLCGLGFFAMGWMFHEGAQMAEENEGFI